MQKKPVMLMILDGFGMSDNVDGNAVAAANKPNYDRIIKRYPSTKLRAVIFSLILLNDSLSKKTSPLTSILFLYSMCKGIVLMVLTLTVTSSPVTPSPLVTPRTKDPFS